MKTLKIYSDDEMEQRALVELVEKPQSGEWGKDDETGMGVPVIRTANFTDKGTINYSNIVTRDIPASKMERKALATGDILIEKSGGSDTKPVGRVVYYDGPNNKYLFNNFTAVLRVKDTDEIISRYLFYYLYFFYWNKGTVRYENKTTGLHNLQLEQMLNGVNVPIRSKLKQQEIIAILDKINGLIELKQQQLCLLDTFVKSQFVEMFGHQSHNEKSLPYLTIDDVAEIYLGITHTPTYVENGVMFISAKNTSGDFLDLSDVKYISREEFEGAPKGSKPRVNDVLFSRVGSNLGHPVILEEDLELCTFVSLGFLRTKGDVTSNYLKHWMRDDFFAKQVSEHVKGGGQPNLNTGWLKEFKIIVPNLEQQKEFDEFCNQADKLKVA